jgi:hypothetical protein
MKRRVTFRVESLDGRILPGASSGGTYLGDLGHPVLTSRPGIAGDGIQVLSSKPGNVGEGIQFFGSKPGGRGEGIQVVGSKGAANPGTDVTGAVTVAAPVVIRDQGGVENPATGGRGGIGGEV